MAPSLLLALPDVLVAKVLSYLPIKDRVATQVLCKQLASIAHEHGAFSMLLCGYRCVNDTAKLTLNQLDAPRPNWFFLGNSQVETLVVREARIYPKPALPPRSKPRGPQNAVLARQPDRADDAGAPS